MAKLRLSLEYWGQYPPPVMRLGGDGLCEGLADAGSVMGLIPASGSLVVAC